MVPALSLPSYNPVGNLYSNSYWDDKSNYTYNNYVNDNISYLDNSWLNNYFAYYIGCYIFNNYYADYTSWYNSDYSYYNNFWNYTNYNQYWDYFGNYSWFYGDYNYTYSWYNYYWYPYDYWSSYSNGYSWWLYGNDSYIDYYWNNSYWPNYYYSYDDWVSSYTDYFSYNYWQNLWNGTYSYDGYWNYDNWLNSSWWYYDDQFYIDYWNNSYAGYWYNSYNYYNPYNYWESYWNDYGNYNYSNYWWDWNNYYNNSNYYNYWNNYWYYPGYDVSYGDYWNSYGNIYNWGLSAFIGYCRDMMNHFGNYGTMYGPFSFGSDVLETDNNQNTVELDEPRFSISYSTLIKIASIIAFIGDKIVLYLSVILIALSLVFNIINIIILSRPRFNNLSIAFYLRALALCGIFFSYTIVHYFLGILDPNIVNVSNGLCGFHKYIFGALQLFMPWISVIICFDFAIPIVYFKQVNGVRKSVQVLILTATLLILLLINILKIVPSSQLNQNIYPMYGNNNYQMLSSCIVTDFERSTQFIDLMLVSIIPFILMSLANVTAFMYLEAHKNDQNLRDQKSDLYFPIALNVLFVIAYFPSIAIQIWGLFIQSSQAYLTDSTVLAVLQSKIYDYAMVWRMLYTILQFTAFMIISLGFRNETMCGRRNRNQQDQIKVSIINV